MKTTCLVLVLACAGVVLFVQVEPSLICPDGNNDGVKSIDAPGGSSVLIKQQNPLPYSVEFCWVNHQGNTAPSNCQTASSMGNNGGISYPGHVYFARIPGGIRLLLNGECFHRIPNPPPALPYEMVASVCPNGNNGVKSKGISNTQVSIKQQNTLPFSVEFCWVDFQGNTARSNCQTASSGGHRSGITYPGHIYFARIPGGTRLMLNGQCFHQIPNPPPTTTPYEVVAGVCPDGNNGVKSTGISGISFVFIKQQNPLPYSVEFCWVNFQGNTGPNNCQTASSNGHKYGISYPGHVYFARIPGGIRLPLNGQCYHRIPNPPPNIPYEMVAGY